MSTNPNLSASDKCFISLLYDELLKDAHCIDSPESWDADPKRPFKFNDILKFMFEDSENDKPKLFLMLAMEASTRISSMFRSDIIHPSILVGIVGASFFDSPSLNDFTIQAFHENGLSKHKCEVLLRSITIYLSLLRGEWPPEYVGLSRTVTYKLKDSDGGQP